MTENRKPTIWEVVDVTSSPGLPSDRKVVARFNSLKEASEFSKQTDEFRVRAQREKRRSKDEDDE